MNYRKFVSGALLGIFSQLSYAGACNFLQDKSYTLYDNINQPNVTLTIGQGVQSIEIDGPYKEDLSIIDSLRKKVTDFLVISKLIKEFTGNGVI